LPDYDIYIEHFAVNENNQTPSFIDQQKYLEGMEWKRELHEKHQTKLVETYSYFKAQGILIQRLSEKLQEMGVVFNTIPNNELLKTLNQFGQVSKFSQLLSKILALFKAAYLNNEIIHQKPEYEDCKKIARKTGKPLKEIIDHISLNLQKNKEGL